MRQILVDHARRQRADKRGGGLTMMSLDDVSPVAQPSGVDVLALDQALDALSSSTSGNATSWSYDLSRGSTSMRPPRRSRYRRPRSSGNGLWRRPGSIGDCRRMRDRVGEEKPL